MPYVCTWFLATGSAGSYISKGITQVMTGLRMHARAALHNAVRHTAVPTGVSIRSVLLQEGVHSPSLQALLGKHVLALCMLWLWATIATPSHANHPLVHPGRTNSWHQCWDICICHAKREHRSRGAQHLQPCRYPNPHTRCCAPALGPRSCRCASPSATVVATTTPPCSRVQGVCVPVGHVNRCYAQQQVNGSQCTVHVVQVGWAWMHRGHTHVTTPSSPLLLAAACSVCKHTAGPGSAPSHCALHTVAGLASPLKRHTTTRHSPAVCCSTLPSST
jgi:hypothetical protein